MANFDTIKTAIDANIKTNGTQDITGGKMNSILKQMVDATDEQLTELESYTGFFLPESEQGDVKGQMLKDFEAGLQDFYINKALFPELTALDIWSYDSVQGGGLYIRYKTDADWNFLITGMPFNDIANGQRVELVKDGVVVGYVVFKDKSKFTRYSPSQGGKLSLNVVTNGIFHTFQLGEESITSQYIAEKAVTIDKTDFSYFLPESKQGEVKGQMLKDFEAGLQDCYIDKSLFDVNNLEIWSYDSVQGGGLYVAYRENGTFNFLITGMPFNDIANGQRVELVKDGVVVGYVVFKDKSKFTRYSPSQGGKLSVAAITNPFFHNNVYSTNDEIKETIDISLPDKITAVVGDTLQLFYRGMIKAVNPYNYDILITCIRGNQYPRYYEYRPVESEVGTTSFAVTIKDNNRNIIAKKECILEVVAKPITPSNNVNILCFGDSLTSNGIWCAEAYRRLTASDGTPKGLGLSNITFAGAMEKEGAGYYGVGGWTWESYTQSIEGNRYRFQVTGVSSLSVDSVYSHNGNTYTIKEVNVTGGTGNILCQISNTTPVPNASGTLIKVSGNGDASITFISVAKDSDNPLWDNENNKMSFIPYANKYCNGKIDIVYTLLSWNGQSAGRTDFTSTINQVKKFADTLHSEFPNAKLRIMGLQVPSVTGGMGANYGATGTSYADRYGMLVTALNMNKAYQDFANLSAYSSFVKFVNVSAQFDTEYNMPYSEVRVNLRNSKTEMLGTNGVHPSNDGYLQIGDIVYRDLADAL